MGQIQWSWFCLPSWLFPLFPNKNSLFWSWGPDLLCEANFFFLRRKVQITFELQFRFRSGSEKWLGYMFICTKKKQVMLSTWNWGVNVIRLVIRLLLCYITQRSFVTVVVLQYAVSWWMCSTSRSPALSYDTCRPLVVSLCQLQSRLDGFILNTKDVSNKRTPWISTLRSGTCNKKPSETSAWPRSLLKASLTNQVSLIPCSSHRQISLPQTADRSFVA